MGSSSSSSQPIRFKDEVARIRKEFSENPIDSKILGDLRGRLVQAITTEESSHVKTVGERILKSFNLPTRFDKASELLKEIDNAILIVQGDSIKIGTAIEEGQLDLDFVSRIERLCLKGSEDVKELSTIMRVMISALGASETYHRVHPLRDDWNRLRHLSLRSGKRAADLIHVVEEQLTGKAEELRKEVEKRSYTISVKIPPSVPAEGNPIDRDIAATWVQAHPPDCQGAVQAIINNTHYVSFDKFHEELRKVIEHVNAQIPDGEEYVMLVQDGKSNKWLAELSLPFLKSLPHNIRGLPRYEGDDDREKLDEYLRKSGVKHVVLLDDACYSGQQMAKHVSNVDKACLSAGGEGYQVHVGIPFMTEWGEGALQDAAKDSEIMKLDIAPHQVMKSIREQIPPKHHVMIDSMYFREAPARARIGLIGLANLRASSNPLRQQQYEVWHKELNERMEDPDEFINLMDLLDEIKETERHWLFELPERFYEWLGKYPKMDQWEKVIRDLSRDKEFEEKLPQGQANVLKREINAGEELRKHDRGMDSRTLTYFGHKVPDHVSTLWVFQAKGAVSDEKGRPKRSTTDLSSLEQYPFIRYEKDCEVYKEAFSGEKRGKEDIFAYFGITMG